MNTGIGDVVDLGWKLAAVVQGWGGPNLLASYDAERQPDRACATSARRRGSISRTASSSTVSRRSRTTASRAARCAPISAANWCAGRRHVPHHRLAARLPLRGLADLVPDGTPAPPDDPENFVASARPGSRAPHVALADGSSTLDLYGRGFVLVRLGASAPTARRLRSAAEKRGVPLRTVTVEEPEAAKTLRAQARAGAARRSRRLARRPGAVRCSRHDRSGARRMMRRRNAGRRNLPTRQKQR